jgi:hypothetical protein
MRVSDLFGLFPPFDVIVRKFNGNLAETNPSIVIARQTLVPSVSAVLLPGR